MDGPLFLVLCIFRPKVAIDSCSNRPLIPGESGHRFRLIPATFSEYPESLKRRWMTWDFWAIMSLPKRGGEDGTEKVVHA